MDNGKSSSYKDIEHYFSSVGQHLEGLHYLILTHGHFDHAGNTSILKKETGARVIAHSADKDFYAQGLNPLPRGTHSFYDTLASFGNRFLENYFRYDAFDCDILIDGKIDLAPLGFNGYVLPTPGHTNGSVSVILNDQVALVGDNMFGVFSQSIYPPFCDDEEAMALSWKKLLDTGCSWFLPGHGNPLSRNRVLRNYEKYC